MGVNPLTSVGCHLRDVIDDTAFLSIKGRGKNVLSQLPSPLRSVLPALQSSSPQNSITILAACRFQIGQTELEYARNVEQIIFSAAINIL
jgi:hypothetical protein